MKNLAGPKQADVECDVVWILYCLFNVQGKSRQLGWSPRWAFFDEHFFVRRVVRDALVLNNQSIVYGSTSFYLLLLH
jgi:hypothetical protein